MLIPNIIYSLDFSIFSINLHFSQKFYCYLEKKNFRSGSEWSELFNKKKYLIQFSHNFYFIFSILLNNNFL